MFEGLTERLEAVWQRLRGKGRLSAADVEEALREIRRALLEADVHFRLVREFVERVRAKAVGAEVLESLTPAQEVVRIVHAELKELLGGTEARLAVAPEPPTVILLVGLQGVGKTTFAAKLAGWLQRHGRHPLLVAADLQRPAAVRQLEVNAERVGVPVVVPQPGEGPADVAARAVAEARRRARDAVVVDTAGRSQLDEALMAELRAVAARVRPHEVLLVLDAMAGQEAVAVAQGFQEAVGVDGVVLTRLDSDARGGAALSVRWATGRPIKFVSTGERLDAIEPFHPDRMASRILGMGDVLTLIEKAEQALAREQAEAMQRRIETQGLTLEDFLEQMQAIRRMGPLGELLGMLPGLRGGLPQVDERELVRATAIIQSMTPRERRHPEILDASRRRRIARGSGTSVQDVNRLLRQFEEVRRLWKGLARGRLPGVPWGGRARGGRPPRERGPRQGR